MNSTSLHQVFVGTQQRIALLTMFGQRRVFLTKFALWTLGISVVIVAFWPTLSVPTQADDMLILFDIGPRYDGSLPREMVHAARSSLHNFDLGSSAHFYPLGAALDVGLKRVMLRSSSLHTTASSIHHTAFLAIAIGTFVASVVLVFRLRRSAPPTTLGAAAYAVPVALGFAACLQVTTPWSTYDPVSVHPIYGALVTFLGVAFLAVFADVLRGGKRTLSTLLCAVLGLLGVLTYEGFYPFVGIAILMIIVRIVRRRLSEGSWSANFRAVSATAPALALILGTRYYAGRRPTAGDYQGTAISVNLDSLTAWGTSVHTTSPAGSWGRDVSTNHPALVGGHSHRPLALAFMIVAVLVWAFVARYIDSPSAVGAAGSDGVETSESDAVHVRGRTADLGTDLLELTRAESWLPLIATIILCPAIFALSLQWSAYLAQPGNTYMEATSAYWAWAMIVGVAVFHTVSRHRSKWIAVAVLAGTLMWSAVQMTVNASAVSTEVAAPTPFGLDLARLLDDGVDLDDSGRCELLDKVPQMKDHPNWKASLNELYFERHGELFCST